MKSESSTKSRESEGCDHELFISFDVRNKSVCYTISGIAALGNVMSHGYAQRCIGGSGFFDGDVFRKAGGTGFCSYVVRSRSDAVGK